MRTWSSVVLPRVPGTPRPLRLYDTSTRRLRPTAPGTTARMYVCGITPYDATHLGHAATGRFGYESGYDDETMAKFFAERGGDPDRPGKRDPLDALLWRCARPGEPSWESELGAGRPGWHIECSAIAVNRLGMAFDVQGGGSDLIFPHHEYSAAHAEALAGTHPVARHYVHAGMI